MGGWPRRKQARSFWCTRERRRVDLLVKGGRPRSREHRSGSTTALTRPPDGRGRRPRTAPSRSPPPLAGAPALRRGNVKVQGRGRWRGADRNLRGGDKGFGMLVARRPCSNGQLLLPEHSRTSPKAELSRGREVRVSRRSSDAFEPRARVVETEVRTDGLFE